MNRPAYADAIDDFPPMPDGTDDAAIEAALRSSRTWTAFRAAVAAWRASSEPAARWQEWKPIEGTEEHPVYEFPHPTYNDHIRDIETQLYRLGAVVVFDWGEARMDLRYPGGAGIADASVSEAARLATSFVRAERFVDGAIEQAVNDGTFDATIERLLRFGVDERL